MLLLLLSVMLLLYLENAVGKKVEVAISQVERMPNIPRVGGFPSRRFFSVYIYIRFFFRGMGGGGQYATVCVRVSSLLFFLYLCVCIIVWRYCEKLSHGSKEFLAFVLFLMGKVYTPARFPGFLLIPRENSFRMSLMQTGQHEREMLALRQKWRIQSWKCSFWFSHIFFWIFVSYLFNFFFHSSIFKKKKCHLCISNWLKIDCFNS